MKSSISFLVALMIYSGHGIPDSPRNFIAKGFRDISQVNLKSCGIGKIRIDGDRIIGGRDAFQGELPWQVSLRYKSWFLKASHMCGASILNERWIVTAAHCTEGRSKNNLDIAVGLYELGAKSKYSTTHQISQIINHEQFDSGTFQNDIALIRLKTPIVMNRTDGYVNGICLPKPNQEFDGFAVASGWGTTAEDGDLSSTLQVVELPLVSHANCETIYGKGSIFSTVICAGEPEGGKDTCSGDSGGPLFKYQDGRAVLVGIVSSGPGCARPGLPGFYTSVSDFIPWILTKLY